MNTSDLRGYSLEKYKKGWVIKKGEDGNECFLGYGDEEGDEEEYCWTVGRTTGDIETQYFENPQEAKDKLKELLQTWNEEKAEFEQRPTEVIKL